MTVVEAGSVEMSTSRVVRLANARRLANDANGVAAFARILGMSDAQASQIIGVNPNRNIGERLARRIEKAFGRSVGWLDAHHLEGHEFSDVSGRELELSNELIALKKLHIQAIACLRAALTAPVADRDALVASALAQLEKSIVHNQKCDLSRAPDRAG